MKIIEAIHKSSIGVKMKYNNTLFDMSGKIVIITGGTGLLGRQYADTLASAGANIILTDIHQEKCEEFAKILQKKYNNKMIGIKADFVKAQEIKELIQKVEQEFGKVNVLINNAAFNCPAEEGGNNFLDFTEYPLELWQKSIDINLTGMFIITQETIKLMKKNNIQGSIINISSTYGIVAPDQSIYESIRHPENKKRFIKPVDYPTTKSGVLNFTRYLAALYGKDGIRVNSLIPGGVFYNQDEEFVKEYSKRTPLNKMADKTDYNGAILFLSSDASKYMTGANLIVDGGWTAI